MMSSFRSEGYLAVDKEDTGARTYNNLVEEALSEQDNCRHSTATIISKIFPWVLSFLFAITTAFLLFTRPSVPSDTYETTFATDIITPIEIPLEQIRFRRSPRFHINGSGWLENVDKTAPWPENMVLFGKPSPQVDENWKRLIGSRYFSISEKEAWRAWGDDRHKYVDERQGGYTAGLDVFHTLHCVNTLREALHPEYYNHHHGQYHLEHCLDAIRQHVQCYGSTTLIPTIFREGTRHNYIDSDQVHTCRSFPYLREFVNSRLPGGEAYAERDLSLVDERKNAIAEKWWMEKNNKKKSKEFKNDSDHEHSHE